MAVGHRSDEHSCGVAANHPPTHCSAITLRAIHDGPRSLQWPLRLCLGSGTCLPPLKPHVCLPPPCAKDVTDQATHRESTLPFKRRYPACPSNAMHSAVIQLLACRNHNAPGVTDMPTCPLCLAPHHTAQRITTSIDTIDTTNQHTTTTRLTSKVAGHHGKLSPGVLVPLPLP